jgi:hypothetical protein
MLAPYGLLSRGCAPYCGLAIPEAAEHGTRAARENQRLFGAGLVARTGFRRRGRFCGLKRCSLLSGLKLQVSDVEVFPDDLERLIDAG